MKSIKAGLEFKEAVTCKYCKSDNVIIASELKSGTLAINTYHCKNCGKVYEIKKKFKRD